MLSHNECKIEKVLIIPLTSDICPNLSQILFVAREMHESGMGANKLLILGIISILYYKLQPFPHIYS